jgi:hypothetical protein
MERSITFSPQTYAPLRYNLLDFPTALFSPNNGNEPPIHCKLRFSRLPHHFTKFLSKIVFAQNPVIFLYFSTLQQRIMYGNHSMLVSSVESTRVVLYRSTTRWDSMSTLFPMMNIPLLVRINKESNGISMPCCHLL